MYAVYGTYKEGGGKLGVWAITLQGCVCVTIKLHQS